MRGEPLPPQPAAIARDLAYRRSHLSVETYPLISYIDAPGFGIPGVSSSWSTYGAGTRAEYRVKPWVSATFDMTASFLGGPSVTETAELGTRFRPGPSDRRVSPFIDTRIGYMHSYDSYAFSVDNGVPFPTTAYGSRYSHGIGAIAGGGAEYSLTRSLSLTTGVSAMRAHLFTHQYSGSLRPGTTDFWLTAYRLTFGLKWNPTYLIRTNL
jgi:hypothetical protein